MTKIKKVVAMALAFLMIFSSASVLANAWTVTVDDGFNLAIGTKFFINNGTEWVETEKVAPGDNVKARVYIGTDYYSNSSTLLFFYDKDFFTHSYAQGQNNLAVNPEAGAFTGKLNPAPVLNSQVSAGYIDSAFLDEYAAISVNLFMPSGSTNAMYDDSAWIFEFDLKVADSATGEGDLFVKDTTVQNSTSQNKALVNVPKGPEGGTNADVWPMWRWNANVTLTSQPVSTLGSVTFDANGGEFADGKEEAVIEGDISDAVVVPAAPSRDGYTFIGWVDATDTTPTYEEAQATVPVATIPYEPVAYNAFWIKNVNITFDTNGGSEIAAHENVTPYTEFAAVAAPTKDGYTFVGWDVRGNMTLPETYPDVNTTYTAIWAKDVVVSFDTNGAAPIESIEGVAGENFEAVIANPSKEGHRFVKWSPALPTVFPEADTTYKAIFEANVYTVYYYVEGKRVTNVQVEYGTEIPTVLGTVVAPEGMKLSGWYTDAAMTKEFVEGTVMGTEKVYLYAKYEYETYNAIFNANGGKFADGTDSISIPTVYLDDIVTPDAPTKVGYEFAGWTPYAKDVVFDEPNDMYFYATWNEVERNVEYYADGEKYEVFNLNTDEDFEIPADPYKEGYTFLYWSETEGGAEATLPATMPAVEDGTVLKYYAVFEINEYTITWDVDGEITEKTYKFDEAIEALADPTKTGYTFAGWANEADEIVAVPSNMPANNVALKATWTIETYTLKFDTVGGNEIGDINVEYNENIIDRIPANPTKEGHTFAGWSEEIPTIVPDLGNNGAEKTFTATWTVNNYTVTWIVDGAEDVVTYAYGADITVPAPTKTGYVFAGWDAEVPATMPAENLTFNGSWNPATDTKYTVNIHTMNAEGAYETATEVLEGTTDATVNAVYTVAEGFVYNAEKSVAEGVVAADGSLVLDVYLDRKTITISFKSDGGSDVAAISGLYGAAVNATEEPAKKGYKFEGWENIPATFPAADTEVKAIWSAKTFDATFDANGGLIDGVALAVVPTVFGEEIVAPADPTMKGHSFKGWTPEVGSMTEEGMSFTAVWETNTYDAIFMVDGEVYDTKPTVFGEAIELPTAPTKPGYIFSTWAPAVGNMTEEGMTFEAKWVNDTATPYTVTVYTMNTDGTYAENTATYGGETGTEATAEGKYTIGEGFKLSDVKENKLSGIIAADNSLALVVYLDRIEYNFTVIVDDETTSTKVLFGATVAAPVEPSKEGHTFAGWDAEVPATMPANDVTVKATWTVNNYTVTWIVDGAEDVVTYAYGADITVPAPTKTGYVFAGWDAEVPATMPAENLTFNGSWNPATDTKYTVNIHTMGLDGQYTTATEVLEGTTDSTVNAVYTVEEGFVYNAEKSVAEGVVAADGSLVLDVYLDRKTVTITFADTGDKTIAPITGLFGTAVEAPAAPTKEGYTFTGWDKPIPATLAEDVTITATWNVNSYTVTVVVDGETKDIVGYEFGATVAAPEAPSKDGYIFAGWAWTNDAGETVAAPETMPAYNVTATATWANDTHTAYTVEIYTMNAEGKYEVTTTTNYGETGATVTAEYTVEEGFELGANSVTEGKIAADGSTVLKVYLDRKIYTITVNGKEDEYYYGEEIPVPEITEIPEGYEQDKENPWVDENGDPIELPIIVDTDNPTEIKPNWSVLSFNITWTVDGVEEVATYEYGATIETTKPAKEGFRFVGWADATGAIVAVPATMPAKNLEFTAVFETNTYAVKYYVDGVLVETLSGEYGNTIATEIASYTVPFGYEFDGWYTDAACETKLADGATITAEVTNLYAKTIAKIYDAIFMVEGEVYATVPTEFDAEIVAPADPVREGFVFTGWDKPVEIMDEEGKEFTATWMEGDFTVTYKADGQADEVFALMFGEEFEIAADPYKEGYTFLGWSLTENGEVIPYEEMPKTMPAENLVYYAVFEENAPTEFTVTWVIDGAETVETLVTGAAIVAPEATKDGFEFKGWSLTENGELVAPETVMGTENLKYYAVFEEVKTVKLKLVPKSGSTGVVERNGVIESYNAGYSVTDAEYDTPANYETYYVYGVTSRRINETEIRNHFTLNDPDAGFFTVETSTLPGKGIGTGSKIKVYSNDDLENPVEEFYLIIFGDLNGDGRINTSDSAVLNKELTKPDWSNRRTLVPYRVKAADINLDTRINTSDSAELNGVLTNSKAIDQKTGKAS